VSTIVMCADHETPATISVNNVNVIRVPNLCRRPRQLEELVPAGETSLMLALHGSETELGRVQAAARRLGFDALGVGVVDLERLDGSDSITSAIVALEARTAAYGGSQPEQVKLLHHPVRTTRRGLFSLGVPTYTGGPMVDPARCVAGDGCRACVSQCPADALGWKAGTVSHDKTACVACGICVTTCPAGAVVNPVASPAAIEAEVRAAIASRPEPRGIRFVCRAGHADFRPGWHDVEVPCTGMLTVGWLLAPMLVGAAAVTAMTCAERGCELGLSRRTTTTLCEAAEVLAAVGVDDTRLTGDRYDFQPLVTTPAPSGIFEPGSTQRAISALQRATKVNPGFVALDQVDVGSIHIDSRSCTACEMCANVCPTDALNSSHDRGAVNINFDSRECVACGQCVTVCPEIDRGAIALATGFDPEDWSRGRRELRVEPTASCEICGRPVAPAAMLERIGAILGNEHSGTFDMIGKRCIECRGR
jgi:formate hydrogenlyase subunit 6/NADH:ubiquinone oxidoreductase subunit I